LGIAGKDLQADLEGRFVGYEINNLSEGIVGDGSDLFDRVDGVGILCMSTACQMISELHLTWATHFKYSIGSEMFDPLVIPLARSRHDL
jgi:hypothetical protein